MAAKFKRPMVHFFQRTAGYGRQLDLEKQKYAQAGFKQETLLVFRSSFYNNSHGIQGYF
jgi:hypothetical protein